MRKSILLSLASVILLSSANAQIQKGAILLGGGFGVSSTKYSNPNAPDVQVWQYSFTPSVGMALKDNVVAGLYLNYNSYNNIPSNDKNYGGGVYYRRYMPVGKSFYLFCEGQVYYNYQKNSTTAIDNTQVTKQNAAGINIYPGIAYAVSSRFHLEASINNVINLSYFRSETDISSIGGTSVTKQKGFGLTTNLSSLNPFNIGFRFLLRKK